jgi:hypothetical protein
MDSFFASNRLSEYIDGQLSSAEASQISAAIAADPTLRAEYESMQRAVSLLRTHGPAAAPASLHADIMARVGQERRGVIVHIRDFFSQVPLEAVALAAAAIIVVVVLMDPSAPQDDGRTQDSLVDVRGGAIGPNAGIEPASELSLPTTAASARTTPIVPASPTPPAEEPLLLSPPTQQEMPSLGSPSSESQKGIITPSEAYIPDWERQEPLAQPETEPTKAAEPDTKPLGTGSAEDDITLFPDELGSGVQAEVATPYEYRITLGDADVLFSLEQLAQSAGGQLLDTAGDSFAARALTVEQNFMRVQLVVPLGRAQQVHTRLKELGGRPVLDNTNVTLSGASFVSFFIEVSYLP